MVFIETPVFTSLLGALLTDDEYAAFQRHLAANPASGDLVEATGGLRKIRWSAQGRGKRGGVRVIYFHVTAAAQIRLVLIYRKGVKDDLSARERTVLRRIVERW